MFIISNIGIRYKKLEIKYDDYQYVFPWKSETKICLSGNKVARAIPFD